MCCGHARGPSRQHEMDRRARWRPARHGVLDPQCATVFEHNLLDDGQPETGWLKLGGTWYWLGGSGAMASNSWANVGGVWYWFDDSGAMATGWRQVGGAWYYFSGSGAMAHDAWVGDYYLQSSGAMATNAWVGSYYVGEDGKWIPGYGLVWYKNGSDVYHTHKCRTVGKDAKGYSQISIQEAQRRGASRECKNCQQIG